MMDWFFIGLWPVVGALVGSFLNVVIWRLPTMSGLVDADEKPRGNLVSPRSYCPSCRAPIPARRNIPLVSFLLQRGRCADCNAPIPIRYFVVEALGALIALTAVLVFGYSITAALAAIFLWCLVALAAIDIETGFLPDVLTMPLIAAGLTVNATGLFVSWQFALAGAVVGYGSFWLIAEAYKRIRAREGLGLGDAKLLAAVGAWAGILALPIVVFVAALSTLVVIGIMHFAGRKTDAATHIPFGPALAFSGGVALLANQYLIMP